MSPDMMYNLPEGIQADILEIATRFREIDMFVLCEFRDGHGVISNPNNGLEDQTDLDLVKYRDSDVSDFSTLCKTHDEDDILPYLGDQRLKEFWLVVFDSLCRIWARNSFYFPDKAQARFYEVQDLTHDLHVLFKRPSDCSDVPSYVKVGISERLSVIDSFLDTCEGILGRHDAGSRTMYDAHETKSLCEPLARRDDDLKFATPALRNSPTVLAPTPSRIFVTLTVGTLAALERSIPMTTSSQTAPSSA
ncbi:hypothetical protein LTR49_005706 [Elasticomyces elasticus]|nr:hypothetical protein LTR49_005706 [Elasticomyces elasticus]KAK5753222.1 hypothetical protein LTS12_016689 [Elasticomyces elasticus]